MNYNTAMARAAIGLVATLLIAGCAVEVPKSALPAFRLTPPAEVTTDTNRLVERERHS